MKRFFEIAIFAFLLFHAIYLQWPYLFEFPGHIHGWAQIDRFALSNGFIRNQFDLFHPETYVYNTIYPGDFLLQSSSTITAVDFPIHDYVVSLLMKLFAINTPLIFKLYVILMGCIGLYFLGKLAYMILEDEAKALFIVAFASLSPLFVYYQGALIPSIPSLALAVIGIYNYFRFRVSNDNRYFYVAIVFFGISLLSRTTFVIPFIALLAMEFFSILKTRKLDWRRILAVSLIVIAFFLYRWHNHNLHDQYGSMFLNKLLPPENWTEVLFLFNHVWDNWRFVYFSSMHYWAIAIIVMLAVIFYFRGPDLLPLRRFFLIFTTVYLFGSLLFAAAMLKQFQDHDYYFLDSFFLPSIFILLLLLSLLPSARLNWQRTLYFGILISWVFFSFRMPVRSQRVRHSDGVNDRLQNTIENFTGSAEYLDEINVPRNATMLVIDAVAPNVPLALMERKGLVVVWPVKGMIELALTWDFDYIVFQNEYFSDYVYRGYPEILNRIKRLSTNGRITICQLEENNLQSLDEFLGLTGKPIIDEKIDFELGESGPWRGYLTSCDAAHSGSRAACFTKDYSSGITLEWTNLAFLKQGYHAASMNFWVKTNEVLNAEVVIWMSSDGKTVFNEVRALREHVNGSEGWQNVNYNFVLPEVKGDKTSLSVYLVNRSSSLLYYDDFSFKVYP